MLDDGAHDIKLLKNMKNHMQEYEILYKTHHFFGPDFFYFWTKAAHYGPAAHPYIHLLLQAIENHRIMTHQTL